MSIGLGSGRAAWPALRRRAAAAPRRRAALSCLLALSWVVPLAVLALAGWRSWEVELAAAEEHIAVRLLMVEDHVRYTLDTGRLALDWVHDRTAGLGWDEIERLAPVHGFLDLVDRSYEQISAIYMADGFGRMRVNSHEFPLDRPIFLADRDYFQALAAGSRSFAIGAPSRSRRAGVLSFRIARPRLAPDGRFDGVVAAGISIERFEARLKMFAGGPHNTVMLLRDDGVILAAYPALPLGTRVSAGPAVPRPRAADAAAIHTVVSPADGIKRLVGYRALAGYPVMVSYGVAYDTVFDAWFTRFALYGMVALAAAMVLSVSTLAALSGERRERVAVAAWQSEQVRRMAAEAEAQRMSKYEALGTLAGGIAHHFNNLLPALTGHLDIAIKEAGADSPAAPRLMRLSAEIDGARQLIRNILLYSRRDLTGFRAVNISALAAGAIEMFRASLDGRTRVRTNIAPGIHVMGDRAQLVEIVMNLLSNARDAVAANAGEIMLTVDRSVGDDGRLCARIICADQGCGMPPEVAERAFDPFYTTKPPGSGTGLGLAICDGIVRSHGGHIAMDTAAGRGTTFTVSIPLLQQGEREPCASC